MQDIDESKRDMQSSAYPFLSVKKYEEYNQFIIRLPRAKPVDICTAYC